MRDDRRVCAPLLPVDVQEILRAYQEDYRTMETLAKAFDVPLSRILKILDDHNIPRRAKSDYSTRRITQHFARSPATGSPR